MKVYATPLLPMPTSGGRAREVSRQVQNCVICDMKGQDARRSSNNINYEDNNQLIFSTAMSQALLSFNVLRSSYDIDI